MNINDLFSEKNVTEDFKSMSQQATDIQNGKPETTLQRQQRIAHLAANQKTRNGAPAGKPIVQPAASSTQPTPAEVPGQPTTTAAVAPTGSTPPANTGPTSDPTLNQPLPPADPNAPPKRGFFKGVANVLGQTGKGIGAAGGAVAGIGRAVKKGYAAGADAVGGPGRTPTGNTQVGNQPVGGVAGVGGNANLRAISSLNVRLSNIEQALANAGIQESIENGKYKVESKFLGTMI